MAWSAEELARVVSRPGYRARVQGGGQARAPAPEPDAEAKAAAPAKGMGRRRGDRRPVAETMPEPHRTWLAEAEERASSDDRARAMGERE